jgi:hypothetical protein
VTLTFCWELAAADWIVHSKLPWQQLVGFGPAGFDAYARLRFLPDPIRAGQSENEVDADWRTDQLSTLFEVLANHTTTPDGCYFCVWEGFGGPATLASDDDVVYIDDEKPGAWLADAQPAVAPEPALPPNAHIPKVVVPNRAYWLFRGPLADSGSWDTAEGLPGQFSLDAADPAFIWPADHAWCIARDVDPHWAGIGGHTLLINQLIADPHLDVVSADPTKDQPFYE